MGNRVHSLPVPCRQGGRPQADMAETCCYTTGAGPADPRNHQLTPSQKARVAQARIAATQLVALRAARVAARPASHGH